MKKYPPAHQYKIGRKTYGLTQSDNDEFNMVINAASKKTYKDILTVYESDYIINTVVFELFKAFVANEELGKKRKKIWYRSN